jgi:ubiquinone/menaquinone biosynthesis C-methylase UbiE
MSYDHLARCYRAIELAAFGTRLEKHRFHFLDRLTGARRALLLGEGDGRFLARFLAANQYVQVDCLDLSPGMLQRARSRMTPANDAARVRFIQADARQWRFEGAAYDLVVTNFFLDCFHADEVAALVASISSACQAGAQWLVTEFHQPASGWRARHAAVWLATMYAFFRIATRLRVTRLPDYRSPLQRAGFALNGSECSFGNFVVSELWARPL